MAVRMEDIANKLQVSIVTVSNALAGRSGVSEELRSQILTAAGEMGYKKKKRRERSVQGTVPERRWRIGVVVSERYLSRYTSFYWEQYQSLVVAASGRGFLMMLDVLPEHAVWEEKLPLMLEEKQVDALIVLGILPKEYLHFVYKKISCPMLLLDFEDDGLPCDTVLSSSFYGMYQMTNYLIREGHTQIGFVGEIHATNSIMDRYQGFSKAMMEHGLEENPYWVIPDRDVRTGVEVIVLPKEMPTAFVCNSDFTAEKLAVKLLEAGYRIPEDISLVSYDDFLYGSVLQGKLTTYAVDMNEMAAQSLKLLEKRLNGEKQGKMVRTVEGEPVIRSSVRRLAPET